MSSTNELLHPNLAHIDVHHHNHAPNHHNTIHHNLSSHILSFTSNLTQPFTSFLSHSNSAMHHNNPNSFSSSNITNNTSYLNVDSNTKSMHNSISCHELHLKHNYHHNSLSNPIASGFHFHLAGFIDPDAGIPLNLLPNIKNAKEVNFIVHWMNNKDFNFTYAAELFSHEIHEKLRRIKSEKYSKESSQQELSDDTLTGDEFTRRNANYSRSNSVDSEQIKLPPPTSATTKIHSDFDDNIDFLNYLNLNDETKNLLFGHSIDQKLDAMVKDWYSSHDVLFCIHPLDGSILIW